MLRLKFGGYVRPLRPEPLEVLAAQTHMSDIDFCYAVLNKVRKTNTHLARIDTARREAACSS